MKSRTFILGIVLALSAISCGESKKSKQDDGIKPEIKKEGVESKLQLSELPNFVHSYAKCANKYMAYDRSNDVCRELTKYEQSMQGKYKQSWTTDENDVEFLEQIGNLQIETKTDGRKSFHEIALTNCYDAQEGEGFGNEKFVCNIDTNFLDIGGKFGMHLMVYKPEKGTAYFMLSYDQEQYFYSSNLEED